MKGKKLTQMQRIARLEKIIADIYITMETFKITMAKKNKDGQEENNASL